MSPDYFVQLLTYDIQNQPSESAPTHPQCIERTSPSSGANIGRPSIVSKFPGLIECATEFIKQHVFFAQSMAQRNWDGWSVSQSN